MSQFSIYSIPYLIFNISNYRFTSSNKLTKLELVQFVITFVIKILKLMQSEEEIICKCIDQTENQKLVSLPLEFAYLAVDIISKQFTKLNSPHEHRIHYLGPRYTNTQTLHKKCSFSELSPLCGGAPNRKINKYSMDVKRIANSFFINERLRTNHFYKTGLYYRAFQGMNPTLDFNQEIIFNGSFQSANLDCVVKYKPREYDLFLRIDSNTRGHLQWFYFSVANGAKIQKIKLNICNISKPGSFYEQQMQPYIFSKKRFEKKDQGWAQGSPKISNINFSQKPFNYRILADKISNSPYCYSFQYQFEYQNDEVYFAYCIPYTYSQLLVDIDKLPKNICRKYILGRTLTGLEIPLLHITNNSEVYNEKRNILITGRVHPGESNGSHVLNGFINYLCSSQKSAEDLRKIASFYIIPMLNPDGVVLGNSRCSASGRDLNRIFNNSDKELFPQIFHLKCFTTNFLNNKEILMYFDFHGHSRKKNTFFYGPVYPISNPNYLKCRVLPRIIQKINNGFRYHSCMFSISQSKKSTGRATMFQNFQIPYTYTVQSSIGFYYDSQQMKTLSFNLQSYMKMGTSICEGTSTFLIALDQYDKFIRQRRAERQKRRNQRIVNRKIDNKILFQDEELVDVKGPTLKIHYKQKEECLFVKLLEQIKTLPQLPNKGDEQQQGQIDKEISSDEHDEKEDFETTKLKQFNNLIIQNARKDNLMNKLAQSEGDNLKLFVRSGKSNQNNQLTKSQRNWQDEQEMNLLQQLNQKTKSKSSHGSRARNVSFTDERSSTRVDFKRNLSRKKGQGPEQKIQKLFYQGQEKKSLLPNFQLQDYQRDKFNESEKRSMKIRSSTVSRSTIGRNYSVRNEQNDKNKHFSEMHFPDQQKFEEKRLLRHQKTDLLRRNLERRKQKEERARFQNINCSQITIIKHPKKQALAIENIASKKMNEFKIDDIMMNLQFRSKMLKDSVKYKDGQQLRMKSNNCMFPSSFYCIRQQINSKKRASHSRQHSQSVDGPLVITVKQFYK